MRLRFDPARSMGALPLILAQAGSGSGGFGGGGGGGGGSKDSASTFTERWVLALDGPADAPWRIVGND